MADEKITVLLTIHGIGFQQFPEPGVPGYADGLHGKLVRLLDGTPPILGNDPDVDNAKGRESASQQGPVYVQSSWPPGSNLNEAGLSRLDKPLATPGSRAAHVVLVYSHLEEMAPDPGSMWETIARGAAGVGHYATVRGLAGMLFHDVAAALKHGPDEPAHPDGKPGGELQVRSDVHRGRHSFIRLLQTVVRQPANDVSGALNVLRTVEDDVAAYVCRNDLRVRVRDFVRNALDRLARRDDVQAIILNSHSQGTVLTFDVLREASDPVRDKVRWLITAGSPLRKYAETLSWGTDVGRIRADLRWCNAWDELDPVADPLEPALDWKRGEPIDQDTKRGLFKIVDFAKGTEADAPVVDHKVDNVAHVPGTGLRAHDYWGDEPDFVAPLAEVIRDVAEGANRLTAADFGRQPART